MNKYKVIKICISHHKMRSNSQTEGNPNANQEEIGNEFVMKT